VSGKPQEGDPHAGSQEGGTESCGEEASEKGGFEIEGQESGNVSPYAEERGSSEGQKSHIAHHEIETLRQYQKDSDHDQDMKAIGG
jgi:hypothetical protein